MGVYNRLRILILDSNVGIRDAEACRAKYDAVLEPFGARYCGYQTHCMDGPNPAHFYLLDDPSEDALATLLSYAEKTLEYPFKLYREYKGDENCPFTFDSIVHDVSKVLNDKILTGTGPTSTEVARCWTGVRVLEKVARL